MRTLTFFAPTILGFAMLVQPTLANSKPLQGSPYYTDAQRLNVEDATQEPVEFISHVLCYLDATQHPEFVNEGAYNARVDRNICETPDLQDDSRAYDPERPDHWTMRVRASRENNSEPQIVRAHGRYTESGKPDQDIYIYARIHEAPAAGSSLDNGKFELQLLVEGSEGPFSAILEVEKDVFYLKQVQDRTGKHLYLQRLSEDEGTGFLEDEENSTKTRFSYDANDFCRQSDGQKYCFSRFLDQATLMPWRYTHYDSSGQPVSTPPDSPPKALPITITLTDGKDIYLEFENEPWLSNESLSRLAREEKAAFEARDQNTEERYELLWSRSQLTRYDPVTRPLSHVSGVRFMARKMDKTGLSVGGYSDFKKDSDYEFYWDQPNEQFVLAREIPLDDSEEPVAIESALSYTELETHFFKPGWSPDMDNPRFDMTDDTVTYRAWINLKPDQADLPENGARFECWGKCPKPDWLLNPTGNQPETVDANTAGTDPIVYEFHSGKGDKAFGLYWVKDEQNLVPIGWTETLTQWRDSLGEEDYKRYEFGVGFELRRENSANDDPLLSFGMGPQFWRHTFALRNSDGQFVKVAKPEEVWFDVPDEERYGDQRGKRVGVRITNNWVDGFNGYCYDLDTHERLDDLDCSGQGWAPESFVPFDPRQGVVTLRDDPDTQYWLKWREAGVLFAPTQSDLTVPEWDDRVRDIWDSLQTENLKDSGYVGPFPTEVEWDEEPKVIHTRD